MTRRVFFSFDYDADVGRVSQVRSCWMAKPERETAGFGDAAFWETTKWKPKKETLKWIDRELEGTFVTVVFIGDKTAGNEFVDYAIRKSRLLGKGIIGIYIHNIKDHDGNAGLPGKNPLDNFCIEQKGDMKSLSQVYPSYDWIEDDGLNNFAGWIEAAVRKAGR
jgi:hypothetical protein